MKFIKVKLKDICTPKQWKNLSISALNENGKYKVYGANGVIGYYNEYNHEFPTLAIACRGSCGQISITEAKSYITSNAMALDNLDVSKVDLKFLKYALQKRGFNDVITGAVQPQITVTNLNKIDLLIPEKIEDQQKIAGLLSQIEELINKRKESIKLLNELAKSTFLEMFINNIENTTWELNKIEDLALNKKGSMRTGPFGSDLLHSEFVEDGEVAVLGIDNAVNNKFMWGQRRYITNEKYEQLKRYTIYPNDIIITIMGTVGRTAVIPEWIPLSINTKHLAALTLNQELVNPFFIAHSLRENPYILNQIKKKTRGALMDGLNLTIIKNLSLLLPPKPLQDKFAKIVTQIENTKTIYQNNLIALNNLLGSIAQRAFKGELDLSGIELIDKSTQILESQEENIEKQVDYLEKDNNPIFSKDFIKMLINQAGQLTNEKLMDVIKQYRFKEKVSFDDIKKNIIELLENHEIEQKIITNENASEFDKKLGFEIKK